MADRSSTPRRGSSRLDGQRTIRAMAPVVLLVSLAMSALVAGSHPRTAAIAHARADDHGPVGQSVHLRSSPLPRDEPELARGALSCELTAEELCPLFVDLALQLDFAWHRAGYSIHLRDGEPAKGGSGDPRRTTGRAHAREIELFVHWTDTVIEPVGAFASVKRTLAHELGHAMHQTCGGDILERWREERSIPSDVPVHGHGHDGLAFNSVAEDFAEAAMAWLTDGEFGVRSPLEPARAGAPYPGPRRSVSPELVAEFFVVCP